MKVALLTDGIWPMVIGGMQRHSTLLAKFLAANGVGVDLYYTAASDAPANFSDYFSAEELANIEPLFIPFPKEDRFPGHYIRSSIKYSREIYTTLQSRAGVDLIYAKGLTSYAILSDVSRPRNIPVCVNVHGYEYFQRTSGLGNKLRQLLLRPPFTFINKEADYVFSYGGKISEIIKDRLNVSPAKLIEIPGAISPDFIRARPPGVSSVRKFLFVGRFERRKGIEEIVSVIKRMLSIEDFEFHFVGDIDESRQLRGTRIFYHGAINNAETMVRVMSQSDVLVCPSYAEGMPNVIMEAMACGCAIIASDVGAVSLLVDHENGWLIKPGSTADLKDAVNGALGTSSSDLLAKKEASIRKIKKFLWPEIGTRTLNAFEQIIEKSHARVRQPD